MRGREIGIFGLLAVSAAAIATDARAWLVGKAIEFLAPSAGGGITNIAKLPWGSIIGVPAFSVAVFLLIWEGFGRATFRARFGAPRVLSEHVSPLLDRIAFAQEHIDNIYHALQAQEDRAELKESNEKLFLTSESIWQLVQRPDANIAQTFLLWQLVGEFDNELSYWTNVASRYDESISQRFESAAGVTYKPLKDGAPWFDEDDCQRFAKWASIHEAWSDIKDNILSKVDRAAYKAETPFKMSSPLLKSLPTVFDRF